MLRVSALILELLSLCGAAPDGPQIEPAAFQGSFDAALEGKLVVPRVVEHGAQRFRYVFVGGFANERMPGYFTQSAQELRAHGVPREAIHFIFPSSHRTFDENCDGITAKFAAIAAQGPEPLVVIAHSRGASDTLAFALQNAEFVRDHVHALFLVQGAFGGTGAADYVLGEGSPMDRDMPLGLRILAGTVGRVERSVLKRGKHDGLAGLTRHESAQFWERMQQEHASAIPIVGPKTFYVTSQIRPSQLRLFQKAVATYVDTYYGPNDGLVALEDQSLPGLGTNLAVLAVSHTAMTHRFPATNAPRRLRTALVESIIMAIGPPEPTSELTPVLPVEERPPLLSRSDRRRTRAKRKDETRRRTKPDADSTGR